MSEDENEDYGDDKYTHGNLFQDDVINRPKLDYIRDRRSCVLNCYQLSLCALSALIYLSRIVCLCDVSLLQFESMLLLLACAHLPIL